MNIHPLFVHFPIGIVGAFVILELIALLSTRIRNAPWVHPAKVFLVTIAALSFIPVFPTGEMAMELLPQNAPARQIVETHEMFGGITFAIFAIIALGYLILDISTGRIPLSEKLKFLRGTIMRLSTGARWLIETPMRWVLIVAGVIAILVTGALGAAMVYGPTVDPIVQWIYQIYF